ncbi:MAG: hypothetical protein K5851_03125 [Lachnospiraceae bacterium]|nr:hypothetical protein [Lachnospiraceae bacterium]
MSCSKVRRIVFMTSHSEVINDVFGFKVIDFLSKPANVEKISKCIRKVKKSFI